MADAYYWLDLGIGFGAPLLLLLLRWRGRVSRAVWWQFWLGAAVGLTWEAPIFIGSAAGGGWATIVFERPLPLHWLVFMVAHTLWDGLLFVLGCALVRRLFGARALDRHRLGPALALVLYGQLQALVVELSSTLNSGWVYLDLWWNPAWTTVSGHNLTLLPQLFWLWGAVCFYVLWLRCGPAATGPRQG